MSTLPTSEESVLPRYDAASLPRWLAREESPRLYKPGGLRPTGPGDILADGRYKILAKAGSGMFSTVWYAKDSLNPEKCVSIKILSGDATRSPHLKEVAFMQTLRDANPQHRGFSHVPLFLDSFETESRFGQHTCIVTELLGAHLPGLMESFENRRAPEGFAKVVMKDLLLALEYSHEQAHIIHADVKLSNLMSVIAGIKPEVFDDAQKEWPTYTFVASDEKPLTIWPSMGYLQNLGSRDKWEMNFKLIDFGVACKTNEVLNYFSDTICSIAARPPESAIGFIWGTPADIWSAGCVLFQLLVGDTFYPEAANEEKILPLLQQRFFGNFPPHLVANSEKGTLYFNDDGSMHSDFDPVIPIFPSMQELVDLLDVSPECRSIILRMLTVDPMKRPSAKELLDDPWFAPTTSADGV